MTGVGEVYCVANRRNMLCMQSTGDSDKDLYITQNVFTSDKVSDSDCQLDLDAVIELTYSGEESESEVRNTVFQKL